MDTRPPTWPPPLSVPSLPAAPAAPAPPAASPPAATSPPTGADQAAQGDAIAIITAELTSWGFGADAINWAVSQVQSNQSTNQILQSLRQQPFYQNSIFGQVAATRQRAGLPAMTESQILAYKDYAVGVMQQAGLPQGFINDSELVTLMGHDVSTSELDARITQEYVKAAQAPQDVRDTFDAWYGVQNGLGNLAAYYLDPQRAFPLLQQQLQSAQIGAVAARTGYGALTQETAMGLAQQGVTEAQAKTGFSKLSGEQQLFNALPGSGEQGIAQQVQLAAEFGGNAQAEQEITQRQEQRQAVFQGGYKYAETAGRGITGLGPAPRNG